MKKSPLQDYRSVVFFVKACDESSVKGVRTMCSPMTMRTTDIMFEGVLIMQNNIKNDKVKVNRKSN